MKLIYNSNVVAEITTNRNLTVSEALFAHGYDINDPDDCEKAYNDGFEPAYLDDNGNYQIDTENVEMVY